MRNSGLWIARKARLGSTPVAGGLAVGAAIALAMWGPAYTAAATSQAPPSAAAQGVPDLEGVFVRADTVGGRYWNALADLVPKADLVDAAGGGRGGDGRGRAGGRAGGPGAPGPGGAPAPQPWEAVGGAGCGGGGFINLMQHSSAFHIVQQKDEVLLVGEMPMTRRVFMDGRKHPDMAVWEGSGVGHSIGRYDGNTLVVETVGFAGGGIPGGGRSTRQTVLTERFKLSDDGKMLQATMTWDDPKIYKKPHVYDFFYQRMPDDAYAFEEWCDMSDPEQYKALGGYPGRGGAALPRD